MTQKQKKQKKTKKNKKKQKKKRLLHQAADSAIGNYMHSTNFNKMHSKQTGPTKADKSHKLGETIWSGDASTCSNK